MTMPALHDAAAPPPTTTGRRPLAKGPGLGLGVGLVLVAALGLGGCATAVNPATAGAARVDVRFPAPGAATDFGRDDAERASAERTLTRELQALAAKLPPGSRLSLVFEDVDLAGLPPLEPGPAAPRRLDGRADGPRLQLRWSLQRAEGRTTEGSDTLTDPQYLQRSAAVDRNDALPYERRLLDEWFARRVLPQALSQR